MDTPDKYPRTFHWPTSPGVQSDDKVHKNIAELLGCEITITEKLDGSNVTLARGKVFGRSTSSPSQHAWHGMVRKHHAWKTYDLSPTLKICGEDLYAIHSIEYGPIPEAETFYIFNVNDNGYWLGYDARVALSEKLSIPMAPLWFRGVFHTEKELSKWLAENIKVGSTLGGPMEGFVIQTVDGFYDSKFSTNVAKYVRAGHVQTDQHWSRNWRPCKLAHG